jgi:5-methylcytosine-specific restriction endonuclease McrA
MSRRLGFGAAPFGAVVIWADAGRFGSAAGLLLLVVLMVCLWPIILLALIYAPGPMCASLVPVDWRLRYRQRRPREEQRSAYIPRRFRRAVRAADRGRCIGVQRAKDSMTGRDYFVPCHRPGEQIDHGRPWSCGGLTCLWNLFLLCPDCNRTKSNYWLWKSGTVSYKPFDRCADPDRAAAILVCERRARRNPARWWRAAWAIST